MVGRGRPRKSEKYGGHIVAAQDIIADRLPSLLDNMFELAYGVTVQEATPDGGSRIYTRPPCRQSNEYLINRILGKPTEHVEHTGEDGSAIEVTSTVFTPAASELEVWRQQQRKKLESTTRPGEGPSST